MANFRTADIIEHWNTNAKCQIDLPSFNFFFLAKVPILSRKDSSFLSFRSVAPEVVGVAAMLDPDVHDAYQKNMWLKIDLQQSRNKFCREKLYNFLSQNSDGIIVLRMIEHSLLMIGSN